MATIEKLRRFWRLSAVERRLTVHAFLLPVVIHLGFHLGGVPRTQAWIRRWTRVGSGRKIRSSEYEIRMACRAQRRVVRATGVLGPCLVRSLTLWAMLLRRGLPVDLRVGFRKRAGKIEGHAWVEHNGVPLNEDPAEAITFEVYTQPASFDMWLKPGSR